MSKQLPPWPPRRNAISVQLLAQFGHDQGLSIDACLAGTGLTWQLLVDPGAEIGTEQELGLIRNLVDAFGHIPGIGLQAGLRYHLNTYGIWGFALLSSPNFRSAADLGLRYLDLTYAFHGMRLEESAAEIRLVLDGSAIPEQLRGFLLERDVAAVLNIQRALTTAAIPLRSVSLRTPPPADLAPYQALFGLTPTFDTAENCISFDRRLFDLALPGCNPQVAQLCEEQCKALLSKRRVRTGLAGRVRDRLLSRPGQLPDMEAVASELHQSSRTLRRRLEDEGTSFRLLQDEVRQALAEELLGADGIRLEEIAERLGYGELSNFIHAFKRWKGMTPRQYRQQLEPR